METMTMEPVTGMTDRAAVQSLVRDVLQYSAAFNLKWARNQFATKPMIGDTIAPRCVDALFGLAVAQHAGLIDDRPFLVDLFGKLVRSHTSHGGKWTNREVNRAQKMACVAQAGLLLRDDLDVKTWVKLLQAVAFEADRAKVRYMRNHDGTLKTPGDSGSEECGWTALICGVASLLMPTSVHNLPQSTGAKGWIATRDEAARACYARPQDVAGDPILRGSNIEADGTLFNHDMLHPRYLRGAHCSLAVLRRVHESLGVQCPQLSFYGAGDVWAILTERIFDGKPIYRPDSSEIDFPYGTQDDSFSPLNRQGYGITDAAVWRYEGREDGLSWCALHTGAMRDLQQRAGMNGKTFLRTEWIPPKGNNAEMRLLENVANTWLLLEPTS